MWPGTTRINLLSLAFVTLLFFPSFVITHVEDVPPPDMVVARVSYTPRSPSPGETLTLEVTVENRGEGLYRGDLEVSVFLGGKRIGLRRVDGVIRPRGEMVFTLTVSLPRELKGKALLRVHVGASREPQNKRGNNWYSLSVPLRKTKAGKRGEWRLVKVSPMKLEMEVGSAGKIEAWFQGRNVDVKGVEFVMVLEGGGGRWTIEGDPSWAGGVVRVVFALGGVSLKPGSYRGVFLVRTRGGQKRFARGPFVEVWGERGKMGGSMWPERPCWFFPKERLLGPGSSGWYGRKGAGWWRSGSLSCWVFL